MTKLDVRDMHTEYATPHFASHSPSPTVQRVFSRRHIRRRALHVGDREYDAQRDATHQARIPQLWTNSGQNSGQKRTSDHPNFFGGPFKTNSSWFIIIYLGYNELRYIEPSLPVHWEYVITGTISFLNKIIIEFCTISRWIFLYETTKGVMAFC